MPTKPQLFATIGVLFALTLLLGWCNNHNKQKRDRYLAEARLQNVVSEPQDNERQESEYDRLGLGDQESEPSNPTHHYISRHDKWKLWIDGMFKFLDIEGEVFGDADGGGIRLTTEVTDETWDIWVTSVKGRYDGTGELHLQAPNQKRVTVH